MPKLEPAITEKLWGRELLFHNGDYCHKLLMLNCGCASSLHLHPVKRETFLVIEGRVQLELGEEVLELEPFDAVTVQPGTAHRFRAITARALVVEASTCHSDNDVHRWENSKVLSHDEIAKSNGNASSDPRSLFCPRCLDFTRQVDKDGYDKICTACGLAFGRLESSQALAGQLRIPKERYI